MPENRNSFFRAIQEVEGKLINGTEGAIGPFFSPDSQWIGFGSGKELKKVPVSGGSPAAICSCINNYLFGGAWGPDNRIVFVPDWNLGIWSVSADGGMPQLLLKTDEGRDLIAYSQLADVTGRPRHSPTIASGRTISADDEKIAILESGATEPRILIQGGSHASYLPSGHLIYSRGGALLSVAFDLSRLAISGTPASVIEGIERGLWDYSHYSVSQNGTLIYEPTSGVQGGGRFAIVDRKGNVQPITERRGNPSEFLYQTTASMSRPGWWPSTTISGPMLLATGTPLRFTAEPSDEVFPQWTPDGTRIAFGTRTGKIFWKPADGSGQREELSHGEYPRRPGSFSPDGKTLAFVEMHPSRQGDIWLMPLDGDRKAQPFLASDANEVTPKFSPDGHWLAYVSNETGRDEIYVRPIGTAGGRKQVSTEGGTLPAWARSGKELFFVKGGKLHPRAGCASAIRPAGIA